MAEEIRLHLSQYGGAAHRDLVLDRIVSTRRAKGKDAEKARRLALSAFELHLEPAPESGACKLFALPLGPDSRRWALERA
ncbi:hypothetical protein ACIQC9_03330 [Brevundimonas sp. NPDC092305]|uniref:hypothetical protein n=1 Tax=Brevundimonas sp. NPDC092305 TaxID=3363957 RepID=UPI0037FBF843